MGITNMGTRGKVATLAAAAIAITGTGAAIAASKSLSPQEESQSLVDATAQNLGVTSTKLATALKQALSDQIDARVEAGDLTKAQGDEMKMRIEAGDVPLLGLGGPGRHGGPGGPHGFGDLSAAADYLGVTESDLRTSLESGTTLADVAKADGKPVDGLVTALTSAAKERIAADVAEGRLTEAQSQSLLESLSDRITGMVNGVRPEPGDGPGPGTPPGITPPSNSSAAA